MAGQLPDRLNELFNPSSVALVGIREHESVAVGAAALLDQCGDRVRYQLVDPAGGDFHGRATVPSIDAIDGQVDFAVVLVPMAEMWETLQALAAIGVRGVCISSPGWAETGQDGEARQRELVRRAEALGMLVLGPNSWGFVNTVGGVSVGIFEDVPTTAGSVAVMAHSGGIARTVMPRLVEAGAGVTYVVTLGNEAMIDAAALLEFFVEDAATRAVVAYLEALRDPGRFLQAARRANAAGKPVIVYQVGSSAGSARVAVAHTGALVGDERALDAVFHQYGIIRVASVDDLAPVGAVAAATGPLRHPGLAFVTTSGGAMAPVTDRAHRRGLPMAEFQSSTLEALRPLLLSYVTVRNPVDTTDRPLYEPRLLRDIVAAVAADSDVGVIVTGGLGLQDEEIIGHAAAAAAEAMKDVDLPWGVLLSSAYQRELAREAGAPFVLGRVRDVIDSLARVWWWSQRRTPEEPTAIEVPVAFNGPRAGLWSEWRARELVAAAGIPLVPAVLASSAEAAVDAAGRFGGPVALKIVAAELAHKSAAGGVVLDANGPQEVRQGFDSILRATAGTESEGVLVAPMRQGGIELLVGVVKHLEWGQMLALGAGGLLVETIDDVRLRRLPVSESDVLEMVSELRMPPGAVDVDRIVEVVLRIASLAQALAPELEALEINPLRACGSVVEALDVLVSWSDSGP